MVVVQGVRCDGRDCAGVCAGGPRGRAAGEGANAYPWALSDGSSLRWSALQWVNVGWFAMVARVPARTVSCDVRRAWRPLSGDGGFCLVTTSRLHGALQAGRWTEGPGGALLVDPCTGCVVDSHLVVGLLFVNDAIPSYDAHGVRIVRCLSVVP